MLKRMQSKGKTPPLPGVMQTCIPILEISILVSQKIENQSTTRPSNITFGHIPKVCSTILQGHLINYVHSKIVLNSHNPETTYMLLIRSMNKENVIHLHNGVYSAVKNNDILKFVSKWIELKNTILSEVIQTQKDGYGLYPLIGAC